MNKNTFWEDLGSDGKTYQMGKQKQRLEIFRVFDDYDVKSFLDVGCGTGPLYQIIKEDNLKFKYKGVDYSSTFVETCKKEFPGGIWEVQDGRKLLEKNNSWDAVVFLHSLDHIVPYSKALSEAHRVARKIVVIVLWRPFASGVESNINSKNQDFEDSHLVDFNKDELDILIAKSGFGFIEEKEIDNGGKYNYMYVLGKYG